MDIDAISGNAADDKKEITYSTNVPPPTILVAPKVVAAVMARLVVVVHALH